MWMVVLRFVLAGSVVAAAPLLASRVGPAAAGLLLAFPTLITLGLVAIGVAGGDVAGAARGTLPALVALAGYTAVVWLLADRLPWQVAIGVGVLVWGAVAAVVWTFTR